MGVPVVTLCGTRHAGRLVASILTSAGLPQFIAHDTEGYVQIAKDLAGDIDRLGYRGYRATLREQTAASKPLCAWEPIHAAPSKLRIVNFGEIGVDSEGSEVGFCRGCLHGGVVILWRHEGWWRTQRWADGFWKNPPTLAICLT